MNFHLKYADNNINTVFLPIINLTITKTDRVYYWGTTIFLEIGAQLIKRGDITPGKVESKAGILFIYQ